MNKDKYSFYLESNNTLFGGQVIAVCYKADEDEIKKYGLTSSNVLFFIKSDKLSKIKNKSDYNYYDDIKKLFDSQSIVMRIQSECLLGMYGDSHCDCEAQRIEAIKIISENNGIYFHLPQEAQGWGLHYKLKELELQVSGRMPSGEYVGKCSRDEAQKLLLNVNNFEDKRYYSIVSKILNDLSLNDHEFYIITDSDRKIESLRKIGIRAKKFSEKPSLKVNKENVSEYLIKICNLTHEYDDGIIDSIISIIQKGDYNERTLLTFINVVDKIKNDESYKLSSNTKKKFIDLYEKIICGEEKRYIIGDERYVKIQNNFSCKVNSSIFKLLCTIYGKNIFDRISLEKMYYFVNVNTGESVRVRTSTLLDNVEEICTMFKGQTHVEQSTLDESKKKVVQKEISKSILRSYFENPEYAYQKRVELVTIISEGIIPGLNIYIKRIPNMENRVLDIYGKSEDIKVLIDKIASMNRRALVSFISDRELSEQNFSQYNLRFADINCVIEEEINMYALTKEEVKDGIRSKVLLRSK